MSIENCSNCGCFHDTQFGCGRKAKTVEYVGKKYREVKRNAEVGELVKVTKSINIPVGTIAKCTRNNEFDDGSIDIDREGSSFVDCSYEDYVVLEPIAEPNDRLLSTVANLAVRVNNLEHNLQTFSTQVEENGYAINELATEVYDEGPPPSDSPYTDLQIAILRADIPMDIRLHLIAELDRKQTALIEMIARGEA
jgi:hypothetical protein